MRSRGPILVLLLGLLGCGQPDQDADVTCPAGNAMCLIAAITTANANRQTNTIRLEAGTYLLTAVDHDTDGPTGLPAITSPWPLTIQGAGAATTIIARDASAPAFRLLRVAAPGTLTLQGLTLRDGGELMPPPLRGAGIYNTGTLILAQSTLADHQGGDGAGIYNTGTLILTQSTLADNQGYGNGAGIYNTGALTLTDCALTGNEAYFGGGGIANTATGTVTLTNTTLAANRCIHGRGGGIANSGTVTLINATVATNICVGSEGGIANLAGSTTLQNTILARNGSFFFLGSEDCSGVVTSLGTNLISLSRYPFAGCALTLQSSDLTGDPGLDAFTDNGGPGQGHVPLLPGSPAIDAGNDAVCPPRDQLGQSRVDIQNVGTSRCDIGAIEFQRRDNNQSSADPAAAAQTTP